MLADQAYNPLREAPPDSHNSTAAGRPVAMLLVLLASLPVVGAMVGCSDGRPERLEVSGQVLIDDEPLTYGFVRFVPKGARPSSGKLDENGRFTLTCYGNDDGVVPGEHRVVINGGEPLSATKKLWHAPKKYAHFGNSPLTQEITESTDSLVINLTWDGGKPFTERMR
jgi:hypothetical protein